MSGPDEPRDDATPDEPDETAAEQPEPTTPEQPAADAGATPPTRPTSASAAAARRARRIGGRPGGAPRQDAEQGEPGEPAKPVELQKPSVAASGPTAGDDADSDVDPSESRTVVITAVPAWLNWAPAAVLSAGALVMAVLLVAFSHGVWWGPDPKHVPSDKSPAVVREQVLAAAKTCVATANTYQYTDLENYESKALACTTGEFTNQLRQTIDGLIKVNAPRLKSSQTAQINRGGIEAVNDDGTQWTILLFGQLSVTNNNNKQPRTDPFAAQVRMDKVNGKWLIGALTTVSSPLS